METVKIVENSKVIKCWRMKGCSEHMPWFSEKLMSSIERTVNELDEGVCVNAELIDNGLGADWQIVVTIEGSKSTATIFMERSSALEKPKISVHVVNEDSGMNLKLISDSIENCFSDALALML